MATTLGGTTNDPVGIATFGSGTTSGPSISGAIGPNQGVIQGSNVDPSLIPSGSGMTNTSAVLGASTQLDPAALAAATQAAADAARAASLRGQVSDLINQINSAYDGRYGKVDTLAGEQDGKLNDRFTTESGDVTRQVGTETEKLGAAHAASGTFDSSYRGNNVDTVTEAGKGQIRDLGQELQDNVAKIASWVASQKGGIDAAKGGYGSILAHLAEETDPGRLSDLRAQIDAKLAEVKGGESDYNSAGQNAQALATIAPSSPRAVQLKTTLSQVVAGNADPTQKAAIGKSLIENAGLDPNDQQQLLLAFQSDLGSTDKTQQA